jgi:hypothetical protein
VELVDDELDDQGLWEAAVAACPPPVVPVSLMSRADRRAAAAADLAARQSLAVAS